MTGSGSDKRREERVATALPVQLEQCMGITRDVSASGIFFETDATLAPGSDIQFVIEIEAAGVHRILRCQGQILRVENRDSRMGVAVQILDSKMEFGQTPSSAQAGDGRSKNAIAAGNNFS